MDRYEGFREFVHARGPALSRTAYLLTGSHANAEELLQEALVKTVRHWRRISQDNPEGYVRRVMVNQRSSWWRRRGKRESVVSYPPEAVAADHGGHVAQRLSLMQALASLPPRQRAVLVLRFYEDLPVAEVADILRISQGTVKRHSHDALARLRGQLSDSRVGILEEVR